jgi:DNA helicase-2/ATP-dependent DNA helicase PcrA
MTHSDVARFATEILADKMRGTTIRAEFVRRFPFIIVDELQDTGWFLGQCVLQLLTEPSVKGVLAGDPDQAIYEFNGARPDMFERFAKIDGAKQFFLDSTLRCSAAVCKVAEFLAEPNRSISPAPTRTGRAFLLSYNKFDSDIPKLHAWLDQRSKNFLVKMVARQSNTIEKITGRAVKTAPKLGSVPLNHLHRAVICFRQARKVTALAATQAALEYAVFGHEGVAPDELATKQISPAAWKRTGLQILLTANSEVIGETFDAWGKRMIAYMEQRIAEIFHTNNAASETIKIKRPVGDARTKIRQDYLPMAITQLERTSHVAVLTVHGVKGETHDLTVFVCADVNQPDRCPSVVWWSAATENQEERRIAFVAVTRTRGDLIVCVSDQCFARLQDTRVLFFESFERMSINDFLAKDENLVRKTEAMN